MNSNSSFRKRKRWSNKSIPSQWSNLGADILEEIKRHLDYTTPTDIHHLRAVCKGWRCSIPFPTPPNHKNDVVLRHARLPLVFSFTPFKNLKARHCLLLKESTIYSLQPIKDFRGRKPKVTRHWFVKIEETQSRKFYLKNPLSRTRIMPIKNLDVINLLDYRVREIGKEYSIQYGQEESQPRELINCFNKVVVGQNKDGEFVVMAIHISGKFVVWKMGKDRWVGIDNGYPYKDIAHHKGRFYAVNGSRRIIAVDCSSLEITEVAPSTLGFGEQYAYCTFTHLVKSHDSLYLINGYDRSFLNVFKLDEELGKWDSNGSWLTDWVMFVGDGGFSCSFLAAEFGGCKGNCIYIRDSCFTSDSNAGLFKYNATLSLTPLTLYSKLFWPPPTWLKSTGRE